MEKFFSKGKPRKVSLLTENNIKKLHKIIATELIDENHTKPGFYRENPVMTDFDSHYPAPEDIPAAMKKFISNYKKLEWSNPNPIELAAWASTQFVLIHPFSDFNGRISRLILNMILRSHNIPFWVALRSNKKERHRYFYALKHYRRGKSTYISTLISIQLVNLFEDLNNILFLAGKKRLQIEGMSDFPDEWDDKSLQYMNWPIYQTPESS